MGIHAYPFAHIQLKEGHLNTLCRHIHTNTPFKLKFLLHNNCITAFYIPSRERFFIIILDPEN